LWEVGHSIATVAADIMLVDHACFGLGIGVVKVCRCQKTFKVTDEIKFQGMFLVAIFEIEFTVGWVGVLGLLWLVLHTVRNVGVQDSL